VVRCGQVWSGVSGHVWSGVVKCGQVVRWSGVVRCGQVDSGQVSGVRCGQVLVVRCRASGVKLTGHGVGKEEVGSVIEWEWVLVLVVYVRFGRWRG
jgi:hypothetical protein